jgi:hypothetical protein
MNIAVLISNVDRSVKQIDTSESSSRFSNHNETWIDFQVDIESAEEYARYNLSQAIPGHSKFDEGYRFSGFLPNDDEEMKNLRNYRNYLLQQSDWTALSDVNLTDEQKVLWKTYRQKLRDFPENNPNPYIVSWPKAPT